MNTLVFPFKSFDELAAELLSVPEETCAVLRANVGSFQGFNRILVREIHRPRAEDYRVRTAYAAELKPDFLAQTTKQARQSGGQAMIFAHSHPGESNVARFSVIDDRGEFLIDEFLARRIPGLPHSAMVFSQNGMDARSIPAGSAARALQVGRNVRLASNDLNASQNEIFDRQVRAFGKSGQAILQRLHVGIVGAGGTGSVVAQELAYLGVRNLTLIDFDRVDSTNLNRLVGATHRDIGAPKVETVARHLSKLSPGITVTPVIGSIIDDNIARRLILCDFVFSCTDTFGSRAILSQIAYQYFVPCIDMGVSITVSEGKVRHLTGRIQMLAPGLPCFACGNLLDSDAVRYDLMSDDQRRADPYFVGHHEPQPSVISINSTVASLAVTMFLGAVVGIPAEARFQTYNGMTGSVRSVSYNSDPLCVICSPQGAFGKGDRWQLPTRSRQ